MTTIEVWVDRPEPRLLSFECGLSPGGHTTPVLTRSNVSQLLYWLWEFDPEAGPEKGGSTIPYLLDDLMELLRGGVFSVAYPTDHGKSTLVDADTVISCLLWPEETLNIVIKGAKETAVASAQACAFKLQRAAEYFPYAMPLCRWDLKTGMPQVKSGFFIEGCRLRQLGERNRSVYPAGIAERAVQGMRGRAKLDDLEDENVLKSEAKSDTLKKQVSNSVRNLQREKPGTVALWAIFGTPQGANSVMYVVDTDLTSVGLRFKTIRRPRVIQSGPYKDQLLFPATDVKRAMQQGIMDPTAYDIAWELKVPGEGRFDTKLALSNILDGRFPLLANENDLKEYVYGRLIEDGQRQVGFEYGDSGQLQRAAQRMVEEELSLYIGWDPATVGTFALCLIAMLPVTRWLIRLRIDSATADEQADQVVEWQYLFPSVMVVVERDGQQDAFIDLLRLKDPAAMIIPHTTHGYNKNTRHSGIPAMMREMLRPNMWHLPWTPEDYCQEYLFRVTEEIRRWGPTAHPHGIPALWFAWYFDRQSRGSGVSEQQPKPGEVGVYDFVIDYRGPLRDVAPTATQKPATASEESWNRRWPSLRNT